ncbi:hypothetical protein SCLCIDRAFT_101744 [Scleroderma citrinum Foug A]|uniref:RNA polymerase II subunit A C-terminal domain phosphatase n=1 Tax=Scleroderma citrinum Foug A TaxID=1036808 RepID=A0A0C3AZC7_9AGAM|nr:hypothetical protein SCLCIDRAFT_101744 [Scleroderma citrinum Foug A]
MSTEVHLPQNFPYPIKITSLDVKPSSPVQRGTRLLSYSFQYQPPIPGSRPELRFGTWDCSLEGTVDAWKVRVGDEITLQRAKAKPVVIISEPCKHGVQVGGLCGLCGKDMTTYDYTGFSDASRASIQMTHSAFGPTVSLEEAQRIERETAERLLKARKLSLIVDLDQTIVHATVDPTVGEWIAEGEAWEARQDKKAEAATSSTNSDSESDDTDEDEDECNPNWRALKDVRKFQLGPEAFGVPLHRNPLRFKGKQRHIENQGCMYYIKPRPGSQDFLRQLSRNYEMHVYTMGTRAYAEEVCAAIDPDGAIFGGRILSRDESESLTQKSLQRLFPCDTSMVVIIDDRADVWEWSPNLIKVIPYDFFVGIGDINSAFLPKIEPLAPPGYKNPQSKAPPSSDLPALSPPSYTQPEERERAEQESKAMLTQNSLALEAQVEERPLAKKQEELQTVSNESGRTTDLNAPSDAPSSEKVQERDASPRKALLKNDDTELNRVGNLLGEVHREFYASYDSDRTEERERHHTGISKPYDVTQIIPQMRRRTLQGVHILFSSVIPLDTRPETTEIWKVAHLFGGQCYTELSGHITHLVAAKNGTAKVDAARKRGGIKIVWLSWFTNSVAFWQRQEETPYLLDDPTPSAASLSPNLDPHQISSDPEPDADDWDVEPAVEKSALELTDIDWNDINDEVEAAMNESDDEDDTRSRRGSVRSGIATDDEDAIMDESRSQDSVNVTPRPNRKRPRSVTSSERSNASEQQDIMRSPLAKRKKLAAGRTGMSKLKEAFTAEEIAGASHLGSRSSSLQQPTPPSGTPSPINEDDEEEDDFLARELEEWG